MNKDLVSYVKMFDGVLDDGFCSSLVDKLNTLEWQKHSYSTDNGNETVSFENELSVNKNNLPETDVIMQKIHLAIGEYINAIGTEQWYNGWSGYSRVRFNKYDVDTVMRIHCDHINTLFDGQIKGVPTLTVLGGLNDDYEGGEFMMWQDTEIKIPAGSVLVFPSNFLYPHEVMKVTRGVRHSYVSWVW